MKAVRDLGYAPQVNVEEGFRRYHDWYQANPILWKKDR
jgi:dTDP-D-glucose 4,6-dehydratase